MKKVSIIIPVYNCEEYIDECLESVEKQTFPQQDMEIIIVNDGSTDNSGAVIEKYLNKNIEWKLINQENKGLSAARNAGLDVCNAEYITFLDSDDYLSNDAVEKLYNSIVERV